jgi:hypothetical protein
MKCDESLLDLMENRNRLPEPFHDEVVIGPILLIRMDENADPRDFSVSEFLLRYPGLSFQH